MIFETHCHLNDDAFKEDLEEVLARAKNNNVTSMCIIGWDKQSSISAINICEKYKDFEMKQIGEELGITLSKTPVQYETDWDSVENILTIRTERR